MRPALLVAAVLLPSAVMAAEVAEAVPLFSPAPLLEWLLSLAAACISAAIPILVTALLRKWNLDKEQSLVQSVTAAASRAAGLGYNWLLTETRGMAPVELKNEAIRRGAEYVQQRLPDYTRQLGLTEEAIRRIVEGELGKLFAVDPNVTVGDKLAGRVTAVPRAAE